MPNEGFICSVAGDIWQLESDLKEVIKRSSTIEEAEVKSRVDEVALEVSFEGFHRYSIRDFLVSHGF